MAAPTGNDYYKNRNKHGRNRIFATAEILWVEACEYFTYCDENPLTSVEYYGKDAVKCEVPKMRAYTMQGLCIYLGVSTGYFYAFEARLDTEEGSADEEMIETIRLIKDIIWNQKFEGAAAGLLHPTIVSRSIGLVEKTDVTSLNEKIETPIINIIRPEGL